MTNQTESNQELNATQLDAQRARNLLDRALGLAERDDVAGAIVTCRQSLALAPNSPQGWSMLGLLHERDGDIDGAIEAYGKTLQLSPTSTLERESLQRLRQKRGAAPRPAPKFNFDEISSDSPQVPAVAAVPVSQPSIPQPMRMDSWETESSSSLWGTFYFRSLPVLVAAVACLALILVTQRVAANRQMQNIQTRPAVPAIVEANPAVPAQPAPAPTVTPSTLPSPVAPSPQAGQVDSSQSTAPAAGDNATAPVIAPKVTAPSKPKAAVKPKPKPKPRPAPKAAPPSEMPVLPRPRLTLPKRPAPRAAVPSGDANDGPSTNAPIIGGGPVDVGSSDDSKYIPVNPPQFPNASRN